MGFTPELVGLKGERVTDRFLTDRKGCPHKGIDFSSSRRPKAFTAGIYGEVVVPTRTEWGTISVMPDHAKDVVVQYLHCSEYSVRIGQKVTPATQLGKTGDTAPPDSGITGIHLHIQVNDQKNGIGYSCWGHRKFVDPATWNTGRQFAGLWTNKEDDDFALEDLKRRISLEIDPSKNMTKLTTDIRHSGGLSGAENAPSSLKILSTYNYGFDKAGNMKLRFEGGHALIFADDRWKYAGSVLSEDVEVYVDNVTNGITLIFPESRVVLPLKNRSDAAPKIESMPPDEVYLKLNDFGSTQYPAFGTTPVDEILISEDGAE